MVEDNYPKAYKEVYEILKYMPEEEKIKIPKELINTIECNMDHSYDFKVDNSLSFEEIPLLRETKAIFAVIYRDYLADENQKERIIKKQEYDIRKEEEEKQKRYNYNDLFKTKLEIKEEETKSLVEYKEPSWYMKFVKFISKFFIRKNKNLAK